MSFTKELLDSLKEELNDLLKECTSPKNGKPPKLNAIIAGVTNDKQTLYLNCSGVKSIESGEKVKNDDMLAYFSCTKSMTAMGLLKLYEEGKIDLDNPVKMYVPEISKIGVIDPGQVSHIDGTFKSPPRAPAKNVTVRHLLCHTAGFAYSFLNEDYYHLNRKRNPHINELVPNMEFFTVEKQPLLFEPGTKWMYGHSFDWLGLVIESVTGKKLGEYLKEAIFDPAGMSSCTFHSNDPEKFVKLHYRKKDKSLDLLKKRSVSFNPELDMGGQGCFGTVEDYLKFIRIWLLKGLALDTNKRILKEETIDFAIQNHLPPGLHVAFDVPGVPELPEGFEPDGFTLTGNAINMNELPTGRPKGALYWAGLGNLYYWIDIENKIGGFWGSQILPAADMYSIMKYARFEFNVYEALNESKEALKEGSSKL
ncbi:uncharacterized protein PRCAT00004528001 [Priceomyces carsonii]|uniref:uncharacterized protein n=1 Tax=Priceomyces carsonii TaxID=28549 RepID=UPI002ED9BECA|nr:unnamed protein product [Priceomyces carsonii]